ncbi:hypothetical protein X798_04586 [Onchocerca flexuosa]|uniref:Uncharacterized protein n=1 Tax=Onchocerca flexuosa TaxID=387005 RepID=A0A238BU04_9BILA|nr:hypothetical protein X798_04586 [Onchocerca flexuosa]
MIITKFHVQLKKSTDVLAANLGASLIRIIDVVGKLKIVDIEKDLEVGKMLPLNLAKNCLQCSRDPDITIYTDAIVTYDGHVLGSHRPFTNLPALNSLALHFYKSSNEWWRQLWFKKVIYHFKISVHYVSEYCLWNVSKRKTRILKIKLVDAVSLIRHRIRPDELYCSTVQKTNYSVSL